MIRPNVLLLVVVVLLLPLSLMSACTKPSSSPSAHPSGEKCTDGPPTTTTTSTSKKPSTGPDAEVAKVLDDWHDAATKADETRYFDHFAKGGVFLGTDGKERWTVPDFRVYAHPHFAKGKAWNFRSTRREITFVGDVAWFDEDLDTPNLGPARGSGVLVKDDHGVWKIAQYNLSVPIPNERFKDVKALIETK